MRVRILEVFLMYFKYSLGIPTDVNTCLANSPPLNALPVPLLRQVFFEANRTAQACVLETFRENKDLR